MTTPINYLHIEYKHAKLESKGFDEAEYQMYFHLHQAEYIRKKLHIYLSYFNCKNFLLLLY